MVRALLVNDHHRVRRKYVFEVADWKRLLNEKTWQRQDVLA